MAELVELTTERHGHLKVAENCALDVAAKQHVMHLRVAEVGQAACNFPLFFTRDSRTGNWALSAMMSLEPHTNVFVNGAEWTATYTPTAMQTYPFYLMQSPTNEQAYTVGIDEQNSAFSDTVGEALFDESGKASIHLSRVTRQLEADIKHDIQTHQFASEMGELGLFKEIDVLVQYVDGAVNTLKGLHTLNEETLQSLSAERSGELHEAGYLAAIHAVLISIYQLNALIRRHNDSDPATKINQIKLEVAKDQTTG